jgi:hypothetical protein
MALEAKKSPGVGSDNAGATGDVARPEMCQPQYRSVCQESQAKSPAQRIADSLGSASRSGDGWKCLCPAHDDNNPSLSVSDGRNGSPVFYCHAGCSQDAVLSALRREGLWPTARGFFAPVEAAGPLVRPKRELVREAELLSAAQHCDREGRIPTGIWSYFGALGDFVLAACRLAKDDGKEFRQLSRSEPSARYPWRFGLSHIKAGDRPLYNLDVIVANPGAPVIVGEGEKAADALSQLFPNCVVTTAVGGAQSPDKSDWSPLAGRNVLIWPDNDKAGLTYLRKVEARLSKLGCVVEVVDAAALAAGAEGWDAADAVADSADLEELRKPVAKHTLPFRSNEVTKHDDPPWQLTARGSKQPCYTNAAIAIGQVGLACRHDVFHDRKMVEGDLQENLGSELSDAIGRAVREAIIDRFAFDPGKDNVLEALERACEKNRFDPVRDYLDRLTWDGVPRVDKWLTTYFGAADTPLHRAFGRKTLIAGVRRARQPGCKFDTMLILEGTQGQGKSKALRILAGDDSFSDAQIKWEDQRQQQEIVGGVWIHEIGELAGLKKADVENVKQFLSRQSDRGRPAYGRFLVDRPRRCIFIGTLNPVKGAGYLTDPTARAERRALSVRALR